MLFFILHTCLYSLVFLCASYLYRRNEDLNPFQFLLMRSVFAITFQAIIVNKNLKPAVWDGVDKQSAGPLVFRSIQGTVTNMINYSVVKYLPLTLIAIVTNMAPLIAMVLAYFLLKENLTKFDVIMLALTVLGIVVVVSFNNPDDTSGQPQPSTALSSILYIALFINPFLVAGSSIAMRKMKKFHEAVVSFYLNWSIGLSSLLMIFILGSGF